MAYINDLAHMSQNSIDTNLGRETYRYRDPSTSDVIIKFQIKPSWDLKFFEDIEIQATMPANFKQSGGTTLRVTDARNFHYFSNRLSENGDLCFEWDRTMYDLPVWFHAVRNLLKRPLSYDWRSASLLDVQFRNVDLDWPASPAHFKGLKILDGAGRTRGKRNYMEDVDFVVRRINIDEARVQREVTVYGVLDGHGGKECALFAADNIPLRIAALLRADLHVPDALHQSFLETDKEFLSTADGQRSGSTANILVYDHSANVFFAACTGDTRCVVSSAGVARDLTVDRKASDPEEIARVAESGGFVVNGRVMGSLAVSRSLGDISLKEEGKKFARNMVICNPELSAFYPTAKDEFIIVATDGLWDVMTSQSAVDFAVEKLREEGILSGPRSLESLGEDIVRLRIEQIANHMAINASSKLNSMDNVTVMIILLIGGPTSSPADAGTLKVRTDYAPSASAITAASMSSVHSKTSIVGISKGPFQSDNFHGRAEGRSLTEGRVLGDLNFSINGRISSLLSNSGSRLNLLGGGQSATVDASPAKGGPGSLSHRLNSEPDLGLLQSPTTSKQLNLQASHLMDQLDKVQQTSQDFHSVESNTQTMIFRQGSATSIKQQRQNSGQDLSKQTSALQQGLGNNVGVNATTGKALIDTGVDDLLDFLQDDDNF